MTGARRQQVLPKHGSLFIDPTDPESGLKVLGELFGANDPSTPILSDGYVTENPNQATDMIQLLMCPNDEIDAVNSSIPEKGRDHPLSHIKSLVARSPVDKDGLPIW
jgi:hypothetical protein